MLGMLGHARHVGPCHKASGSRACAHAHGKMAPDMLLRGRLQVIRMVGESQETVSVGGGSGSSSNKMPTLEEYGTNLTTQATEVTIHPGLPSYPILPTFPLLFLCVLS